MIIIDNDGTISLYQGDSGEITIDGLDSSTNYTIYLAIRDKNRKLVGNELQVVANNTDTVTFILTSDFTDLLTVPDNKNYEIYYYGIKACTSGNESTEDTLFVSGSFYGDENRIIVYPRKVKGA